MRYPATEKLEIIRLVEQSPLPVRHTLAKLGIPRATFYRWYDRHSRGGSKALNDRSPRPDRVWNRIPNAVRDKVIKLALEEPALSPRELAVRFTDTKECRKRVEHRKELVLVASLPCPRAKPRTLESRV